ncbi:MAG TPA: hypothetical protein VFE39_13720, partial [Pseudonocardia sp.]|nr:hypothetical protein [Pseudonocardia sp.]
MVGRCRHTTVRSSASSPTRSAIAATRSPADLRLDGDKVVDTSGEVRVALAEVLGGDVVEETVEFRHRPTEP